MRESLPEGKAFLRVKPTKESESQDGEIFQMHLFEHWIQLCLKPELLLGSLAWELINFLFWPELFEYSFCTCNQKRS